MTAARQDAPASTTEYYRALSRRYDWFLGSFDEAAEQQQKLLQPLLTFHGAHTVLDCACGTGLQCVALAEAGFDVVGSDLSAAMLEEARKKAREHRVDVALMQSDIRELPNRLRQRFDAVVCMGNVLPHLLDETSVMGALRSMHAVLRAGGLLVVEMRCYDELLRERPRFIPFRINGVQDGRRVTILYALDYLDSRIRWHTIFLSEDSRGQPTMEVESVDYRPMTRKEVQRALERAGFREVVLEQQGDRLWCHGVRSRYELL